MTNETRNRIRAYMEDLPRMREKVFGALLMLVIAASVIVASAYAWVTLSRSPETGNITTTLAANGALEIALAKPDGSLPDEFDIDEAVAGGTNVTVSNLQWGNLVNLSDSSYGIDNLALRPAQLNTTSLLTSPLWGAVYGGDGRITNLNSNYAYAKYNGSQFLTTNEYGVRAIATYKAEISDATQQAYNEKVQAVVTAHTNVNQAYAGVAPKFSSLGTMISKYAQAKLDDKYTNLAPYISSMIPVYKATLEAMEEQKTAYVALANLQNYLYTNEIGAAFTALTWDDLARNKAQYNTANAETPSAHGNISLVGLTQFIADYELLQQDIMYLERYAADYKANSEAPYYWAGTYVDASGATVKDNSVTGFALNNIVTHLIDYTSMTIDLDNNGTEVKVVALGMDNAGSLLGANGQNRKVYAYNGILYRLEQNAVDEAYRIGGGAAGEAQCTITVNYYKTITVYGKAYTKASGACHFMENYTATLGTELVPSDAVAEDTYGLAIDLWVRTNAETTCLTLEGATSTDVQGNIVSYDGINRIWGATGEATLTTDSTTQGGGSCYVYYADTPEDMERSLDLLKAMKVAFVDAAGNLLATAEMDTANYWAVNGRITVPMVLDNQTKTTYIFTDSMNVEQVGYAVTTMYADVPVRVTAIVYLDGTRLTNNDVLAAAEIQGSLNIQFGSSVDLETIGSNDLIDDVRTVTATVSPAKLNYDTAKVDADMTSRVTVNLEGQGAEPNKVTAFFVRAINSTQGTREETMTFTKQPNGTWICDYKFTAPGTYYLRQVRLDGVDYTLAEPQKVEVSGFGLSSVTWSEMGDSVVIRTSEGTHSTSVTIQFASNDRSKLPASVQARFVRDDGNTVSVPLIYNASGHWIGTGFFSASGVYQLQYLLADGRYIDLALNDGSYRTMELSLGMYVTVTDLSGGLVQEYEEGQLYPKNVSVHVYNNAGTELMEMEGLRLYYSNGGSATNTINTDLAWDELDRSYTGTLPIEDPGRYRFLAVTAGSNYLTKCTESPVYTVISPDPPIYDAASACTKDEEHGLQFVPLTNDAVIDGIYIANAASASASAVVYSAASDSYYTVDMLYGNNSWYIKLPTYNGTQIIGEDANGDPIYEQLQDGEWSIAAIRLWDCYDADSNFREEADPILWVDSGTVGQNYLTGLTGEDAVTPDAYQDFSKLTTNVSALVNVLMDPGTASLGSTTTEFGTVFAPTASGMTVTLTDGAGRPIPGAKIGDITLNLNYAGNTDTTYGYKVSSANTGYVYKLNTQDDAETGTYTVSSGESWWYAGRYSVESLVITIGEETNFKTLTYLPGSNGVPAAYTVTTKAPTAANVTMDEKSVGQGKKEFGGSADNVTGTFLESHNLDGTYVDIKLTGAGGQSMDNAVLDGLRAELVLTYLGGSMDKGGYTFTGDTGYQSLTLAMTERTPGSGLYSVPGKQILLAGIYQAKIQVAIGGTTQTIPLDNITVWSVKPDVKITGVSPTSEVLVNKNNNSATNNLVTNAETFKATNQYGDHYAVVYMSYAEGAESSYHSSNGKCGLADTLEIVDNYANYTKPRVTFALSNFGVNADSTMTISGNEETVSWASGTTVASAGIGSIVSENVVIGSHKYGGSGWNEGTTCNYMCVSEKAIALGSVDVDTITSKVGNATYTRTLANPLVISQLSQENPTLTWNAGAGVTISVKAGSTTYTATTRIPAMTGLTVTVKAETGYHHPKLAEPESVYGWTVVREGETEAVYSFQLVGDATLSGSATKYPAITFSDANNAVVSVTVGGKDISTGLGGKAGAEVVVTVTSTGNFCMPRLAQPSGVSDWTAKEGDFESTYTFTMPDKAVSLASPTTTAMYRLSWIQDSAVNFLVTVGNSSVGLANPSYVVPGKDLTIKLVATGGLNPELKTPSDAKEVSVGIKEAIYTYQMNSDLQLECSVEGYPKVRVDTQYASFRVESNGVDVTAQYADGVSIKPEFTAKVILTAADGWYAPRMSQPSGVSNWKVVREGNGVAEYTFTMPYAAVDARAGISATPAPAVTFEGTEKASLSVAYNDYGGNPHTTSTSGTLVQPGALVTVTLSAKDGWYAPRMTAPADVTGWTAVREDAWSAQYTFTMGTETVNLTAAATAMPVVSVSASNVTLSMTYTGYLGEQKTTTQTSGSVKVVPGTTVSVTVNETANYYNPMVSASGVTITGGAVDAIYSSRTYTSAKITSDVTLTARANAYPTITYVKGEQATLSVNVGGQNLGEGQSAKIRPGTRLSWSANFTGGEERYVKFTPTEGEPYQSTEGTTSGTYTMPEYNVTATASSKYTIEDGVGDLVECVTPDTLITLADGTQVRVDALTGDELLLVWNMETGMLDAAPVMFVDSESMSEYKVIHLYFSDGTEVKVIAEHGFWDYDLNRYVYLDKDAAQYIGHSFAKETGGELERVTLVDVVIRNEVTTAWSPVTVGHLCYFVNDMLSMPGGVGGLFNIFDVDPETMRYDMEALAEDIAVYGLFTYEEMNAMVPLSRDMFDAAGGAYLKISIGKGNLTMEELVYMIERYSIYFE